MNVFYSPPYDPNTVVVEKEPAPHYGADLVMRIHSPTMLVASCGFSYALFNGVVVLPLKGSEPDETAVPTGLLLELLIDSPRASRRGFLLLQLPTPKSFSPLKSSRTYVDAFVHRALKRVDDGTLSLTRACVTEWKSSRTICREGQKRALNLTRAALHALTGGLRPQDDLFAGCADEDIFAWPPREIVEL